MTTRFGRVGQIHQAQGVVTVSRARIYSDTRVMFPNRLDRLERLLRIGDRDHNDCARIDVRRAEDIQAVRFPIIDFVTEAPDDVHLIDAGLDRREWDAAHRENAPDDLTYPTNPAMMTRFGVSEIVSN